MGAQNQQETAIEEAEPEEAEEQDIHESEEAPEPESPKSVRSRAGSECSEGWHRPPVFDAELEGSEVGDSDMERHQRAFGITNWDAEDGGSSVSDIDGMK